MQNNCSRGVQFKTIYTLAFNITIIRTTRYVSHLQSVTTLDYQKIFIRVPDGSKYEMYQNAFIEHLSNINIKIIKYNRERRGHKKRINSYFFLKRSFFRYL